jgi:5'-3' exonuclease
VDPVLKAQFTLAEEALTALGVVVWPMVEWEADDALGTAALRWGGDPAVERVMIMTPDKDMGQCVREDGRVVQFDRRQQKLIDADGVRAKFGVSPESIPDFLALVGDSSDGYPGIPGWGKVAAATVLTRYGHLEEIPESVARWDLSLRGAATLAASLREHRDLAFLFRELATLVTDVPLPETLDDLRWRGAHRAAFAQMCERLGAPGLADRVPLWLD